MIKKPLVSITVDGQCLPVFVHMASLTWCDALWQANTSRVQLPAVPYGTRGPWAINLWFKPSSEYGTSFQYLYSHNSTQCYNYTACPYAANQV